MILDGEKITLLGDPSVTGDLLKGQKTVAGSIPVVLPSNQYQTSYSFNKLGTLFSVVREWSNVGTSEKNLIHIFNPNGSGKNLVLFRAIMTCFDTVDAFIVFRLYGNPTITGNGTALTINNGLITASPTASVANAYYDPSTSALGTQRRTIKSPGTDSGASAVLDIDGGLIIAPNNRVLITGTADGTNRDVSISLEWGEEDD